MAWVMSFNLPDGRKGDVFRLSNQTGHVLLISSFGGIIHSWVTPDATGKPGDILLGCPDWPSYGRVHPYFGALIGRYANRIGRARFVLHGKEYRLSANMAPHQLHGGFSGFDKKIWEVDLITEGTEKGLHLSTVSEAGEEGFPGKLIVGVRYTLNDEGMLTISYQAAADEDTHINLTSHPYFNLSAGAEKTILNHNLQIMADLVTDTDVDIIPTGTFNRIEAGPLDFTVKKSIGRDILEKENSMVIARGYDHNFILRPHQWDEPVAVAEETGSGRRLDVFTDQPALQFYTGNWLAGVEGKTGKYATYAGFCLETQHYPDSPNHSHFPSTLLRAGETWQSKTAYKISIAGRL